MSEKYALSWQNYSETVSNSFARFKNEEYLHDVTLVTDDNRLFLAHKFVLSTCSEYFRNILKRCKGQNPYICLEGVEAEEMENIIAYIYSGHMEILQVKLDKFLAIAKRLKIEGLFDNDVGQIQKEFMEEKNVKAFPITDNVKASNKETKQKCEYQENPIVFSPKNEEHFKKVKIELSTTDIDRMDQIINSFVARTEEGKFKCTLCNKAGKYKQNIQSHIETHLEGLELPCTICRKTFRSKQSLRMHLNHKHTKTEYYKSSL